jgi:hypothetical protein
MIALSDTQLCANPLSPIWGAPTTSSRPALSPRCSPPAPSSPTRCCSSTPSTRTPTDRCPLPPKRLVEAAIYLIRIRPVDIPDDELRRMLVAIKDDLAFDEPKGKEGQIAATLEETADADASEIARRILELHDRLGRLLALR